MHYIIIGLIIIVIVILQVSIYINTVLKLRIFKYTFPSTSEIFSLSYEPQIIVDESWFEGSVKRLYKGTLKIIIDSINNYLGKNKGAISDFHLIKDIVERNCDAKDEEINTQIPVPLYLGLVGTMAGILVGVGFLVFSGDLDALLGNGDGNGAEGVKALLGGVAVAMISSILGILLTTFGSAYAKNAKARVEANKNTFLSWIQANLLPKLSDGTAATLEKMTHNLSSFNSTFAKNTQKFQNALSTVTDTYKDLSSVLQAISNLKINKIAQYNIEVYDKLKNCTDEIGYFSTYLHNVNEYIANVQELNEKLDKSETRTRAIEDMGKFFQNEIKQIENRKDYIAQAVGKTDDRLQQALESLQENAEERMKEFNVAAGKQQDALQHKLEETTKLYEELQNLTAVKTSIGNLEKATNAQNHKFAELVKAIEQLAATKAGVTANNSPVFIPKWAKITGVITGISVSIAALIFIVIFVLFVTGTLK